MSNRERDLLDYYLGPTGIPDRIRALNEFNPVAGIMNAMQQAGRAADSNFSPEQRRAALGEATFETGIALLPVGLARLASLFRIPARMSDTSADVVETFTGARPDVLDSAVEDASRRRFLQGVGATGVMAALPPGLRDDITEIARAAPRAAAPASSGSRIFDAIMQARQLKSQPPENIGPGSASQRDGRLDLLDLEYQIQSDLGELNLLEELNDDMLGQLTPDELAELIDGVQDQLRERSDDLFYEQDEVLFHHLSSLEQVLKNRLRAFDAIK